MKGLASTIVFAVVVGLGIGMGQPALADDRAQAIALYGQGEALYDHGDFQGAAARFEDAYKAVANPTPLQHRAVLPDAQHDRCRPARARRFP